MNKCKELQKKRDDILSTDKIFKQGNIVSIWCDVRNAYIFNYNTNTMKNLTKEQLRELIDGDINAMFYLVSTKGIFGEEDVDVLIDAIFTKINNS